MDESVFVKLLEEMVVQIPLVVIFAAFTYFMLRELRHSQPPQQPTNIDSSLEKIATALSNIGHCVKQFETSEEGDAAGELSNLTNSIDRIATVVEKWWLLETLGTPGTTQAQVEKRWRETNGD